MILGIESSCDESAVALLDPQRGILHQEVHSQVDLHELYGGVVPDLASREHLTRFPVLLRRLSEVRDLQPEVNRIAVTCGPGLAGCLAIGIAVAKSLALAWGVDLVGVNHLRAHAWSPFIPMFNEDPEGWKSRLAESLPHLGVLVSGGNTLLFSIDEAMHIEVLASTRDDAAGEALDKGAKLLGLPYPGGPLIERYAERGNPEFYPFPRAMKQGESDRNRAFSFSGLKTSLRYYLEKLDDSELERQFADICASYQEAVMDQLAWKTECMLESSDLSYRSLGLSGGVANNRRLRSRFQALANESGLPLFIAHPEHCGDNACMIAFSALIDQVGLFQDAFRLGFHPALTLESTPVSQDTPTFSKRVS